MKKGTKMSLESRAKMSAARRGKRRGPPSIETRMKISAAMMGKKASSETRAKMSASKIGNKNLLGHKHTPETIARMSVVMQGSNNPNWGNKYSLESRAKISESTKRRFSDPRNHPMWLGGISREPYAWTFDEKLKEAIRCRDGYQCQLCGASQAEFKARLPVHHIDYDKKNSDPMNLTALCNPCNSRVNTNREHWTAFFQEMMIQRANEDQAYWKTMQPIAS